MAAMDTKAAVIAGTPNEEAGGEKDLSVMLCFSIRHTLRSGGVEHMEPLDT